MKTNSFQRTAFFLLLAGISVVFLWMIHQFVLMLVLAAVFAGFSTPLYQWFLRKLRGRRSPASMLTLLTLIFVVGIPVGAFVGLLTNEAIKISTAATPWVKRKLDSPSEMRNILSRMPGYKYVAPYRETILNRADQAVTNLGRAAFSRLSALTSGTITFFLQLALMLYAMFFIFIYGEDWLKKILQFLPLKHEHEMKLLKSFESMTRATIKATLTVGVVQGVLGGLALGLAGIPSAVFWGTVMAFASLLPTIGPAIVWIPASVILLIQGELVRGILLFLWCALVVGSSDNILRPMVVGRDVEMNELMILISTLGGIFVFGLPGFILGPVLASLFVTLWDIYGEVFKDDLPAVGKLGK